MVRLAMGLDFSHANAGWQVLYQEIRQHMFVRFMEHDMPLAVASVVKIKTHI